MNYKEIANKLKEKAKIDLDDSCKDFKNDPGMIGMFEDDYQETIKVAEFIELKDIDKMHNQLWHMETMPREIAGCYIAAISKEFYEKYMVGSGWIDYKRIMCSDDDI